MNPQIISAISSVLEQKSHNLSHYELFNLLSIITLSQIIELQNQNEISISQDNFSVPPKSNNTQDALGGLAPLLNQLQQGNNNNNNLQQLLPLLLNALNSNPPKKQSSNNDSTQNNGNQRPQENESDDDSEPQEKKKLYK